MHFTPFKHSKGVDTKYNLTISSYLIKNHDFLYCWKAYSTEDFCLAFLFFANCKARLCQKEKRLLQKSVSHYHKIMAQTERLMHVQVCKRHTRVTINESARASPAHHYRQRGAFCSCFFAPPAPPPRCSVYC